MNGELRLAGSVVSAHPPAERGVRPIQRSVEGFASTSAAPSHSAGGLR